MAPDQRRNYTIQNPFSPVTLFDTILELKGPHGTSYLRGGGGTLDFSFLQCCITFQKSGTTLQVYVGGGGGSVHFLKAP